MMGAGQVCGRWGSGGASGVDTGFMPVGVRVV